MQSALSIAGSDPTGGAGIQLDLRVFQHLGVHGAAVPTALTVQDTQRVHSVLPAFPSVVLDQLRVLLADLRPDAIKIGMLATDDIARSVLLALESLPAPGPPRVVDPVLAASDGTLLLERRAYGTLKALCRGAAVVTPNLPEAALLSGEDVSSESGIRSAARALLEEIECEAVLVKGGHRDGPADDWLAEKAGGGEPRRLPGERIDVPPVHGTGCALSSAIAAGLARGEELGTAVDRGREFVRDALRASVTLGKGARLLAFGHSETA